MVTPEATAAAQALNAARQRALSPERRTELARQAAFARWSRGGVRVSRGKPRVEYRAWWNMLKRCSDPSHRDWKPWGGRKIAVCKRWRESFDDFLSDMGPRPGPEYSLDRIDNDGNYEPGNCRWATRKQQMNNTRKTAPSRRSA